MMKQREKEQEEENMSTFFHANITLLSGVKLSMKNIFGKIRCSSLVLYQWCKWLFQGHDKGFGWKEWTQEGGLDIEQNRRDRPTDRFTSS